MLSKISKLEVLNSKYDLNPYICCVLYKASSNLACLQDIYLVVGYVYNSILYVSIPIAGIKSYDIEVINILSITSHSILNSIIETAKGTNVYSITANVSLADGAQFVQIVFKVTID